MTPPLPIPSPIPTKARPVAYDAVASTKLEIAYLDQQGLNPDLALAHLSQRADPTTHIICVVPSLSALHGFKISALAATAFMPLQKPHTLADRLRLMDDLLNKGACHRTAAGDLMAMYADVWRLEPETARALMIGSHNLHLAVANKLER